MDWENKFSSIVKETESNLARVRERLGTAKSSRVSFPMNDDYSSHIDSPMRESKLYSGFDGGKNYHRLHSSDLGIMGRVRPVPNITPGTKARRSLSPVKSVALPTSQTSSQNSPALINVLFERVEHQAELVNSLSMSMKALAKDRANQETTIKSMEDEIYRLNERLNERGADPETERKLEEFRREIFSQLEAIQSQTRIQRVKGERHIGELSSSAVARDLQESKRLLQENNDSLRREFDHLKTRIGKIELDLQSVIADTTDVLRKHERMDRTIMSISENQRNTSRSLGEVVERKDVNDSAVRQLSTQLDRVSRQVADLEVELQLMVDGKTQATLKSLTKKKGNAATARSNNKLLKNTPQSSRNTRSSNVKRSSNKKLAPEFLELSLSDTSDVDLSLSTLELNSASDSELTSTIQVDNLSKEGFAYSLSSSLDSDDLLGEFSH